MEQHTNHHSKYDLAYCEFYNSKIHGKTESSSKNIDSNYLIFRTLEIGEFYDDIRFNSILRLIDMIRAYYIENNYSQY